MAKTVEIDGEEYKRLLKRIGELESIDQQREMGKQADEAARIFQEAILDGVAEPIMVIGVDYHVRLMNRLAREFSGRTAAGTELGLCYEISHQQSAPCAGSEHPCPLEQVKESGQPVTVVHQHYQADGELRFVELVASPLWGPDGSLQGIIESMRDITERRRAEEAVQQYAQRLRALTAKLAEVAEAERQRLARELHDQVGQNLTALGITLNIIRSQLPAQSRAHVESRLEDSQKLVEETAARIRDLMAELRPAVLDDYGLVAALRWYGQQFAWRTGIAVSVEGEESGRRLPAHVENALFRIAQESLTNVAKHAQATNVTIQVELGSKFLRQTISDNGIGFDPATASGGTDRGWGLLTMSERAQALGGMCHVDSIPGRGTQVVVEVPL
jgi:two-component system sensor histidine kinase UhpB